jgi:hypothetical protein
MTNKYYLALPQLPLETIYPPVTLGVKPVEVCKNKQMQKNMQKHGLIKARQARNRFLSIFEFSPYPRLFPNKIKMNRQKRLTWRDGSNLKNKERVAAAYVLVSIDVHSSGKSGTSLWVWMSCRIIHVAGCQLKDQSLSP